MNMERCLELYLPKPEDKLPLISLIHWNKITYTNNHFIHLYVRMRPLKYIYCVRCYKAYKSRKAFFFLYKLTYNWLVQTTLKPLSEKSNLKIWAFGKGITGKSLFHDFRITEYFPLKMWNCFFCLFVLGNRTFCPKS